ncbi:MAG: VWA domain-containing protein [Dehalococcoidia bacterium]|nr:VWA domain-containing protein [Dehalococcoidia bacterium]
MSFASPALLLLALPALGLLAWRLRPRTPRPAFAIAELGAARGAALGTWRLRLRVAPAVLRAFALATVAVALARPQQGLAVTTLPEEGIDVVVALDVSSSMNQLAADRTTRLAAARSVVTEFVAGLEGDRAGIVIFQSRALALAPLTLDHQALARTVSAVRSGLLPDGTAIGLGVSESLSLLRNSTARSRVVVLLTDGENNSGEVPPLEAAQVAKALGVRLYTIGFVAGRGPGGAIGIDEAALRQMATLTGGGYYNAATREELSRAYAEIGALERSRVGERRFTTYREFAPWLAGAAVALLALELALRSTWLRRYP